jgi:hypothetical protein
VSVFAAARTSIYSERKFTVSKGLLKISFARRDLEGC